MSAEGAWIISYAVLAVVQGVELCLLLLSEVISGSTQLKGFSQGMAGVSASAGVTALPALAAGFEASDRAHLRKNPAVPGKSSSAVLRWLSFHFAEEISGVFCIGLCNGAGC